MDADEIPNYIEKRIQLRKGDKILTVRGSGVVKIRLPRGMIVAVQNRNGIDNRQSEKR